MADGYREADRPGLPDVELTGDEFLHVLALWGELVPGSPRIHDDPDDVPGQPDPECPACASLLAKGSVHMIALDAIIEPEREADDG